MNSMLLRKQAATGYPNEVELLSKGGDRLFEVDSLRKPGSRMLVAIPEDGGMGDADYPVYDPETEKVKFQHGDRFSKKFKDAVKKHMKGEVEEAETPKEKTEAVNSPALRAASLKQAVKCPTCGSEVRCNCPPPKRYKFEPHPSGCTKVVHAAGADEPLMATNHGDGTMTVHVRTPQHIEWLQARGVAPGVRMRIGDVLLSGEDRKKVYPTVLEEFEKALPGILEGQEKLTASKTAGWDEIRSGDRLTIKVPGGVGRNGIEWVERTGRAVMHSAEGGWVLNMGGPHGTPGLATRENTTAIRHAPRKRAAATVHDIKPLVDKLRQVDPAEHMDNRANAMDLTERLVDLAKRVGARDLRLAAQHYLEVLEKMGRYGLPGSARHYTGADPMPPRLLRTHERAWKQLEAAFVHFVR